MMGKLNIFNSTNGDCLGRVSISQEGDREQSGFTKFQVSLRAFPLCNVNFHECTQFDVILSIICVNFRNLVLFWKRQNSIDSPNKGVAAGLGVGMFRGRGFPE